MYYRLMLNPLTAVYDAAESQPFRDMASAPMNGTSVELIHGLKQEIARAHWAFTQQGWIRDDDTRQRVLVWVTGWRPMRPRGSLPTGSSPTGSSPTGSSPTSSSPTGSSAIGSSATGSLPTGKPRKTAPD